MAEADLVLYSDGGSSGGFGAAGACIVEWPKSSKRLNLICYLGEATNNEGEIVGGLVGYSLLYLIGDLATSSVRWVCDSQYVLKSATQYIRTWTKNGWRTANKKPVKNQGLWRAYLHLTSGLEIIPEHVAGHSGHVENELCDFAVGWARQNAVSTLQAAPSSAVVELSSEGQEEQWLLLDGRDFIRRMRKESPTEQDYQCLGDILRSVEAKIPEVSFGPSKRPKVARQLEMSVSQQPRLDALIEQLKGIAQELSAESDKARELSEALERLLKDFSQKKRR